MLPRDLGVMLDRTCPIEMSLEQKRCRLTGPSPAGYDYLSPVKLIDLHRRAASSTGRAI
jgi:hypothetical protein